MMKGTGSCLAAALVLVLSGAAYSRNAIWHDDFSLWREAVQSTPRKSRVLSNFGLALFHRGDIPAATRMFELALEISPGNKDALGNLAVIYLETGEYDKALQYAMRAIPNGGKSYNTMGEVFMKTGDFSGATDFFAKAISVDPGIPHYYFNAALALEKIEKREAACEMWRQYADMADGLEDRDSVVAHMRASGCR